MEDQHYIFVYGTLLNDKVLECLKLKPITRTPATTTGYKRVSINGKVYPTAIPSSDPKNKITGELHRVTSKDLAMLDIYEGCPEAFYERVTVDSVIATESGEQKNITAFMYIKGHALDGV